MSRRVAAFAIVFVVGAGLRLAGVWRPIDRADNLWREADLAGIARNFDREGMNILYPRVDWRGDGPGYVEMEFPIYPWTIAWAHRGVGLSEAAAGRLLSVVCSLLTLATFFLLAIRYLPERGAIAAAAFFALNPLAVEVASLLLADGLMFFFYVLAAYAFLRWIDAESWWHFAAAALATAAAILAKAPALHLGLLFALLVLWKYGAQAVRQPRLWGFAVVVLVAPFLWYRHAYGLWQTYGNSLGVSNEYHWVGWDIFTNPRVLAGIGKLELLHVWMPPAVLLVAFGYLWSPARRAVNVGGAWLAVIALYYVVTARTTHGIWGLYYHIVAVPAVALLVGAGADAVAGNRVHWAEWRSRWPRATRLAGYVGMASLCAAYAWELAVDYARLTDRTVDPLFVCAQQFKRVMPEPGLIVASGGLCTAPDGRPLAGNKPYMFYWLDRKGFNVCEEAQSVAAIESFAARGATYFVAEREPLHDQPGVETQLRGAFPVVAECDAALLLQLHP